jgi:hypothetical protein
MFQRKQWKVKCLKIKKLGKYSSAKILHEYSAFRASTRLFVAIPIEYSWKSGKCMNKFKKEKKVKENTTRQSENWQPSDV